MVFNTTILLIILGIFAVWLAVCTVVLVNLMRHYNQLTRGVTTAGLKDVLEKLLDNQKKNTLSQLEQDKAIQLLAAQSLHHIQRIGLVRFNPFADTGGSQSFTLAILDKQNTGIVMTSLYARSGNRWYIKEVAFGKAKDVALSKEEEAAIHRAETREK
jgi:hypothetical protein